MTERFEGPARADAGPWKSRTRSCCLSFAILTLIAACGGPPASQRALTDDKTPVTTSTLTETEPPTESPDSGQSEPISAQLVTALTHHDTSQRLLAVDALTESKPSEAIRHLSLALHDADGDVREAAIETLGAIGSDTAALALAPALDDPDSDLREEVVYALSEIRGQAAHALLQQALSDSDPNVAMTAQALLDRR